MQRIYVLDSGSYLRKSGDNLALVKDGSIVEEINIKGITQLILMGYASVSGAVLRVLMENRIETVLLNPRGRFQGRLSVDEHKHVARRKNQYLKLSDPSFALASARQIVQGKMRTQARLLASRGKEFGIEALLSRAAAIKAMERALFDPKMDLEAVRGLEGNATKIYFEGFKHLIRNASFSFNGRTRRPPLDPINALLSFVYTLLTGEVLTAIKIVGLDPYLGCLHAEDYGRPSLACDLVEEWRVFLGDRLVLGIINRKAMVPDDFLFKDIPDRDFVDEEDLRKKRPVEMKPAACRAFLAAYEKWMAQRIKLTAESSLTYRGLILEQIRKFERYLSGEEERYECFPWSQVA
jgi:CRISPR-associated protein Cas1